MEKQNITLSLPKDLLKKVKHLSVEKNTSVTGLLTDHLEQIVMEEEAYNKARERQLHFMKEGFNFNLKGSIPWKRSDLYDR